MTRDLTARIVTQESRDSLDMLRELPLFETWRKKRLLQMRTRILKA
jgi:hypothetical protein